MSEATPRPGLRRYQPPPLEQLGETSETGSEPCLQPRVLLQREGDRIKRIDIVCPCGNTIQVDCDYEDPA